MKVMRTTVATVVAATLSMSAFSVFAEASLTGAGATFPAPVYAKWADTYQKETGNKVNYQGIGSSGGVKQIIANTVDFGASDAPLSDEKLAQEGLFQFPTVIGGVVLAVNIPGLKSGELVLDGKTLGDIYLGKIKKWDDEAIAKLNPGLKLPSQNIAVVRRADGSGTSFVFTSYLAKVNEEWKNNVGTGSTVKWPIGLGGKGNDGIAAFVQRLPGAIGYVEYAYAKQNNQGIGSSGGVKQIIANTVDFGASDAPLSDEKLAQEGLFQFPTVIGGVVLAVNLVNKIINGFINLVSPYRH